MTKRKSNSSTALLDAPVLSTSRAFQVIFCDTPGPRPDGLNLWVDIEINLDNRTALFHCMDKEVVGSHRNRMVTFRADHTCRLNFTNVAVFDISSVDLNMNKQIVMHIQDNRRNISTDYTLTMVGDIEEDRMGVEPVATGTPRLLAGPHIVVP